MLGYPYLSGTSQGSSLLTGSPSADQLLLVVLVLILFAARRFYSSLNGTAYTTGRLFRMPALYLLFTILSALDFGVTNMYIVSTLALIPVGAAAGVLYATKCTFFYRNGRVFYRRQVYVLAFWMASFLVRLSIEFLLPFNLEVEIAFSAILSSTTGLVLGEAFNIRKKYIEFVAGSPVQATG